MPIVPLEKIASQIYVIRGEKVMVDRYLAELYGVTTSALNQQVKRNAERFPQDFAFQLTSEEVESLLSQIVIAKMGRGGRRSPPMVFTEQGVAMLSSVIRSERAAQINVAIMRTFVKLRELLLNDRELARKVEEHDQKITVLFETVQKLLSSPAVEKKTIGFVVPRGRE